MRFSIYTTVAALLSFVLVILGALDTGEVIDIDGYLPATLSGMTYLNIPSLFIVLGGVLTGTFVMFPFHSVLNTLGAVRYLFSHSNTKRSVMYDATNSLLEVTAAYKKDKSSFRDKLRTTFNDPYVLTLEELLETNYPAEEMRKLGESRIENSFSTNTTQADILSSMATSAPAFGMLGTILGLIAMLRNLEDPSAVGPSLAVALITTLYGVIFANLVFLPLSKKIRAHAMHNFEWQTIVLEAFIMLRENRSGMYMKDRLFALIDHQHIAETEEKATK